jgi:predicted site-specific integrase-resolvase
MAKRTEFSPVVSLEYSFDRLLQVKLQRAYEALVPDLVRVRTAPHTKERCHEAAVIYARVSSDKQKEENTIASQTAALRQFAQHHGFTVSD